MFIQTTPVEAKAKNDDEAVFTLRDIVRGGVYQVFGREPMLRVPYDLYSPEGAVEFRGGIIHYREHGKALQGAVALSSLAEAKPGERVLVRVPPRSSDTEWWLCEVEARNGIVNE